jgi:acyl-CoA dehydrogenase
VTALIYLLTAIAVGYCWYHRLAAVFATVALAVGAIICWLFFSSAGALPLAVAAFIGAFVATPALRINLLSRPIFGWFKKALPALSQTEKEAIDAGTVWWDGELFSGKPDWPKLLQAGKPVLTEEEQAFIDGPATELARMSDKWSIGHDWHDIPPAVYDFIKQHRFLGMIIPKAYGGLEFSAVAQSEVLTKVFGSGSVIANFISVPNSLGPGELLMKYGTEEQKNHYLPRLADGRDVPCFALTSPTAGSDATSISDTGVVCEGQWDGETVLGMRLNFQKRYITLAPIATLIGLAFRLQDPDHLIGDVDDYGITCALIPRETDGMQIGQRHFPIGEPFMNGPIQGTDVFVPLSFIIGGQAMAGKGWTMLVNCLSVGRCITLPTSGNAICKMSLAGTSAYATLRQQFGLPIAKFEGVQKPLARIAGLTYIVDAGRLHTAVSLGLGEKPSVPSAILKYHCTELARTAVTDAMDIHGGKAVMKGPKNYISALYESAPVAITVEGANIMTRNLMIFGQGATRSHPYVLREMELAGRETSADTIKAFDDAFFGHIGFTLCNVSRSLWLGLTRSAFTDSPVSGATAKYYRDLNRLSAAFALVADVSMLTMQSKLKFKEMLSARLGDLLSNLYLASMVLKHYEDGGRNEEELPVLEWSMHFLLHRYQTAMQEILQNYPNRPVAWMLKLLVFPTGKHFDAPSDRCVTQIAKLVSDNTATRRRLIDGVYLEDHEFNPLGNTNAVFLHSLTLAPIHRRIRDAVKAGKLPKLAGTAAIDAALEASVIDEAEAKQLREHHEDMMNVIHVDDFSQSQLERRAMDESTTDIRKSA